MTMTKVVTMKRSSAIISLFIGSGMSFEYKRLLRPPLKEKPADSRFPPLESIFVTPNVLFTEEDHWILKLPTIVITCICH